MRERKKSYEEENEGEEEEEGSGGGGRCRGEVVKRVRYGCCRIDRLQL